MTTQNDKLPKDTSVPQDEADESEVGGRALQSPETSVPQDPPRANTSVPQDNI